MRSILFRGKLTSHNAFVYGLVQFIDEEHNRATIRNSDGVIFEVYADTIGQYTGLDDKHGVKIFDGDVLRFSDKWEWYRGSTVEWWGMTQKEKLEWVDKQSYYEYTVEYEAPEYNLSKSECKNYYEVTGNIHGVEV